MICDICGKQYTKPVFKSDKYKGLCPKCTWTIKDTLKEMKNEDKKKGKKK